MMKEKRTRFLFCFVLILLTVASFSFAKKVRFTLRRGVVDSYAATKPARFNITWPGEEKASYLIDAGLSVIFLDKLVGSSQWSLAAGVEYHRNTEIDDEQNVLIGTLTLYGVLFDVAEIGWALRPHFNLKYIVDEEDETRSILASAQTSLVWPALAVGMVKGPKEFGFFWEPKIGIEYEKIVETGNGAPKGYMLRLLGAVDVGIYPLKKKLDKRFELLLTYQYWKNLSMSAELDNEKDQYDLLTLSASFYLNKKKNFALALEYVNGENPEEGFDKQECTQVTFKVKF